MVSSLPLKTQTGPLEPGLYELLGVGGVVEVYGQHLGSLLYYYKGN